MTEDNVFDSEASEGGSAYKSMLAKCGILAGFFAVVFGLLVALIVAGRSSWKSGLRLHVQAVLDASGKEVSASDWVAVRSGITTSCAVYELEGADPKWGGGDVFAAVMRVPTLYGPVAAVYVSGDSWEEAECMGFVLPGERIAARIEDAAGNSQVAYWARKIPSILRTRIPSGSKDGPR